MTAIVLWLFLTGPWVGLQCVIVVFPDHTQSLFYLIENAARQDFTWHGMDVSNIYNWPIEN